MRKAQFLYAMLILIPLLTSCSGTAETVPIELSQLRAEDGSYIFPPLRWGMGKEEVEAALERKLLEADLDAEIDDLQGHRHRNAIYPGEEKVRLNGNIGDVSYQFADDMLISVTIRFLENQEYSKHNDVVKLCERTIEQAAELWGPADESSKEEKESSSGKKYMQTLVTWNRADKNQTDTNISLALVEQDGETGSFTVMVASPYHHHMQS